MSRILLSLYVANLRRYIINLKKFTAEKTISEGDSLKNLTPIVKGEFPAHDLFINNILRLPKKTQVFHFNTDKIIPPIELIGGRETRPIGDTCRMFFRVKQIDRVADYYIWDGIVDGNLNELTDENCGGDKLYQEVGEKLSNIFTRNNLQNGFGLATGRTNYRIVLLEKIKKAPQSGELY